MDIQLLLSEVSAISKKYEAIYEKTGAYYNIFNITGISTDEVKICSVLQDLLNPYGCHQQGDCYLRLFIEAISTTPEITEEEYRTVRVYREYAIDESRRIDLVIQTDRRFIPIEVKLYAGDQNKQCYDYYQRAKQSPLYYLTLDGHSPSAYSAEGLTPELNDKHEVIGYSEVKDISFGTEILEWLDNCLKLKNTISIAPIREIIIQLISVIRSLTNQNEEGKEMEINQLLTSSKENISAALEIEKTITESKQYIIRKVLHTLEERIGKPKLLNRFDYEQESSLVDNFYKGSKLTCPGISYFYKNDDGIDFWFRIEIGWYLYAGFCISLDKTLTKKKQKELEEKYPDFEYNQDTDSYWLSCGNLPENIEPFIDFKHANDGFADLYDPTYFDEYISKCVAHINEM